MSDSAWYADVAVLARRPDEFWPTAHQSEDERLNSLIRLVAYVSLGVYMYRRDHKFLSFGLGAAAFLSLVHRFGVSSRRCGRLSSGPCPPRPPTPPAPTDGRVASKQQIANRPSCTMSTPNNPFANALLTDDPGRPPACRYDEHSAAIWRNFNRGLARNAYDVYDKENSQRQFMTNPVTTSAPDTNAFARFAYGSSGRNTCKETPSRCTGSRP